MQAALFAGCVCVLLAAAYAAHCARKLLARRAAAVLPELRDAIVRLGVRPGDVVVVHSSLRSLRSALPGATAADVIATLFDVIGPDGTLMAPTFGHGCPSSFDPASGPCRSGAVSSTLMRWRGAQRSLHPTHSVTAVGHLAHKLTEAHAQPLSPALVLR